MKWIHGMKNVMFAEINIVGILELGSTFRVP